jgi:hypothetical protein
MRWKSWMDYVNTITKTLSLRFNFSIQKLQEREKL